MGTISERVIRLCVETNFDQACNAFKEKPCEETLLEMEVGLRSIMGLAKVPVETLESWVWNKPIHQWPYVISAGVQTYEG